MTTFIPPTPLSLKPDLADAARRWQAYLAGDLIDRPIVCVHCVRDGMSHSAGNSYYQMVHDDFDAIIDRTISEQSSIYHGGESVPAFCPSFGPDEVAAFCGGDLYFNPDSDNTNWSHPFVQDWSSALPILLQEQHPLWQRMRALYRRGAERLHGMMAMRSLDLHTNMDLLAAMRGPQQLCFDLLEIPDIIDQAMLSARAVFAELWQETSRAGRMNELGYCNEFYSMQGSAVLQCDFSCMISPEMFNRWVMPALEEEAALVKHAFYHWDGPGALVHADTLLASSGLHTFGYVPGDGAGRPVEYMELSKRIQAAGKGVFLWGSAEELQYAHSQLAPDKVIYSAWVDNETEAERLLDWFVEHT